MVRGALRRGRAALDPGPDPYRHLDAAAATRLGGAMFLAGFTFAGMVLPIAPPDGPLGWPGVVACMALAAGLGILLLRMREPAGPLVLLAGAYTGLVATAAFRASAGPGAPFEQLLFMCSVYTCVVHPFRRAATMLAFASAAAFTPLLYERATPAFVAGTIGQLALQWGVGLLVVGWMTGVRRKRGEQAAAREQADLLARVDVLTGVGNRRALEEALPAAVALARRTGEPLALLIADLDAFKGVNDAYGHQHGDEMLRGAARGLTSAVRVSDPCFRWGGDEFVALLPSADAALAREIAERVQTAIALSVRRPDGRPLRVSVGVAELQGAETGGDLLARADEDLLAAKSRRAAAVRHAG